MIKLEEDCDSGVTPAPGDQYSAPTERGTAFPMRLRVFSAREIVGER